MEENKNGIPVLDGFTLLGKSNLDKRKNNKSLADLLALKPEEVPEGMVAYVEDEDRYYRFSTKTEPDPVTKHWHRAYLRKEERPRVEGKTLIL